MIRLQVVNISSIFFSPEFPPNHRILKAKVARGQNLNNKHPVKTERSVEGSETGRAGSQCLPEVFACRWIRDRVYCFYCVWEIKSSTALHTWRSFRTRVGEVTMSMRVDSVLRDFFVKFARPPKRHVQEQAFCLSSHSHQAREQRVASMCLIHNTSVPYTLTHTQVTDTDTTAICGWKLRRAAWG